MGKSVIQAAKCLAFNRFGSGHLLAVSLTPDVPAHLKENKNLKERAAMFGITSETLRQFSLAEVLILIAMNIETESLSF